MLNAGKTRSKEEVQEMGKRYVVTMTKDERAMLEELINTGKAAARKLTHARILLKADQSCNGPGWQDQQMSEALEVSVSTIERVRRQFVEEGLQAALLRRPSLSLRQRKIDGVREAQLIALACSQPPEGRARWTMRLLADKLVALDYVDTVSHETVRQVLKKTSLNLS
jgi:transposase